ncbi:hypothetical protein SAMN02910298_01461 [Pseudobutyrivibrio sp. YE44]|uniref:hypothetical protein n=1 Tax=Pseudobutyrivibrio sp. YE44 TaxID=1520802 RepID=UPI0008878243|nr:hypothetical protein [Pseudobutyrivibrio sp. YE44]SDB29768.1 hypothetical protein SAMN02910298_01461 [Pseudobutyrivibrio sp. YE44]
MQKKILITVLVVFGILIVLFFTMLTVSIITEDISIKDVEFSFNYTYETSGNEKYTNNGNYNWYKTLDEAQKDKSIIHDFYGIDNFDELNLFYSLENSSMVRKFYSVPKKPKEGYRIITMDYLKKDNMYSQIVNFDSKVVNMYEQDGYKYDCADSVIQSLMLYNNLSIPFINTEGNIVYIGFWSNGKELESTTIDNVPFTDIIDISYDDGKVYYMWIYDGPDIREKLSEINGKCTYRKLIELLNIEYVSDDNLD